jgi:predicted MFS family arabinose efflux permease
MVSCLRLSASSLSATLPRVSEQKDTRLLVQLVVLALVRTIVNTGIRMVYPFAPALARGLGVELTAIYDLVTIRNFAGFLSPLFGPLTERFGRRSVMIQALLLFSLSSLLILIWPNYWLMGCALVMIGLSKVIFDPAMQAYVGDTVPYERRGKAFAVTELSWAGALLVGAPAAGVVIQFQGWQAPFLWLALLGGAATVLLGQVLPQRRGRDQGSFNLRSVFQVMRQHPVIWAAAAYTMLAMTANEVFFIVYGDWMESSFDLQLASLGLASGVIGGAEIIGELFAGWSVDRFGKRAVIITTGLLNALMYLVIAFTSSSLLTALVSLFTLFLFFEITVVGAVPLISEIVPDARGAVMATVLAFGALGRSLGDVLGPKIWASGGLAANGLVAATVMVAAVLVLAMWVREGT